MPDTINPDTAAAVIRDAVRDAAQVQLVSLLPTDDERVHVYGVPKGRELACLEPLIARYRQRPRRATGTVVLATFRAFIDHVERFAQSDDCVVFHSPEGMIAVYNYHQPALTERSGEDGQPGHCDFRAALTLSASERWQAWSTIWDRDLAPAEFAEFLEDHLMDVAAAAETTTGDILAAMGSFDDGPEAAAFARIYPDDERADAADLLETANNIELRVETTIREHRDVRRGTRSLMFVDEHNQPDGDPFRPPSWFVIAVAPYEDVGEVPVLMRLRYRVRNNALTWRIIPVQIERIRRTVVTGLATTIVTRCNVETFAGELV